jgi:hypothetical protein
MEAFLTKVIHVGDTSYLNISTATFLEGFGHTDRCPPEFYMFDTRLAIVEHHSFEVPAHDRSVSM